MSACAPADSGSNAAVFLWRIYVYKAVRRIGKISGNEVMLAVPEVNLPAPCAQIVQQARQQAAPQQRAYGLHAYAIVRNADVRSVPDQCFVQSLHQVVWNQGRIAGDGREIVGVCKPHGAGHAGQRSGVITDVVAHYWITERLVTLKIAVRIDDHAACLGPNTLNDMVDHGLAGKFDQPLVFASHALRAAAGEYDGGDVFDGEGIPAGAQAIPAVNAVSEAAATADRLCAAQFG